MVFVSRFDTRCGNTVQFNKTDGGTVTFYPAPCSAIPIRRMHNTYTREFFTAGGEDIQPVYFARGGDPGYRLREIYLVDGSVITYTFTSTSTVNVACMAIVYVFQNYTLLTKNFDFKKLQIHTAFLQILNLLHSLCQLTGRIGTTTYRYSHRD